MPEQIKDALGLDKRENHGFVNGYVSEDVKLFIDYNALINNVEISNFDKSKAYEKVIDFFRYNFKMFRTNPDLVTQNIIIHENNDTHFGVTSRGTASQGKGPSPDTLKELISKVVDKNLDITILNEPMDLLLLTHRLGKDYFSDLITNIIFKELYNFSTEILDKYNVLYKVRKDDTKEIVYWDNNDHQWKKEIVPILSIKENEIALVPTYIASKKLGYSVSDFLNKIVVETARRNEIEKHGYKKAPTKEEIKKKMMKKHIGKNREKDLAFEQISNNHNYLKKYHDLVSNNKSNIKGLENDNDID